MRAATLERHELRASIARCQLGDADDLPGIGEVGVAPIGSKTAIARRAMTRSASGSVGARMYAEPGTLDRGSQLGRLVVMPPRIVDRLDQRLVRGVERPGAAERSAEVREQRRALCRLDRKESDARSRSDAAVATLVAIERAPSRAREQPTALQRDRTGLVHDRPSAARARYACSRWYPTSSSWPATAHRRAPRATTRAPSWRSARSSFGIDAYATSRMSTWLNRKPSSPS